MTLYKTVLKFLDDLININITDMFYVIHQVC